MEETLRRWLADPFFSRALAAGVTLLLIYLFVRLTRRAAGRYVKDVDNRYRIRKILTFAGYLLSALALASIFSDRLTGFTVAFGVAGAGIAFALQELIASVAGWIAISLGGFYSPGDRVQLGGIKGDVIDISILRTTLMEVGEWVKADLYTGRIVRITNSFVFKEPVFNYSGDFPFLWDEITLPVRYGSDWKAARAMLRAVVDEVLKEYSRQFADSWEQMVRKYRVEPTTVEPMITLQANDNWIEFTVRYVVDYRKRRWMRDYLFTRILEEVDKSGDRIRLASATFELVRGSEIEVRLAKERVEAESDAGPHS